MKIVFELRKLQCIASLHSHADDLKLYVAAASDSGSLDKLESDSEASRDSLDPGVFDLAAGQTLQLGQALPIGRQRWLLNPVEVTDNAKVGFSLIGLGQGKIELTGGAEPESLYNKIGEVLIRGFLKLIPKVGDTLADLLDLAEKVGAADPDKNCYGPLFNFNRTFDGADLVYSLVSGGPRVESFSPEQTGSINVTKPCGTPQYSADFLISLADSIAIRLHTNRIFVANGPAKVHSLPAPRSFGPQCGDAVAGRVMQCWVSRFRTVVDFRPTTIFSILKYEWCFVLDGAGHEITISEGDGDYDVPAYSFHFDPNDPSVAPVARTGIVAIHCHLDTSGNLEASLSENSGDFDFTVRCYLRRGGDKFVIYSKQVKIENEAIDGNEAYNDYLQCVQNWSSRLQHVMEEFGAHLKSVPSHIHVIDPIARGHWQEVLTEAEKLAKQVGGINDRIKSLSSQTRIP